MSDKVQLERHPPERRRRPVMTLNAGCTCCCCCCCLHTVGSLLGAAIAPALRSKGEMPADEGPPMPPLHRYFFSGAAIYWWVLSALILIIAVWVLAYYPNDNGSLAIAGVLLSIFMPFVQFVATVVAYLIIEFGLPARQQDGAIAQLAKIFYGTLLGGLIGLAAMIVLGGGFLVLTALLN